MTTIAIPRRIVGALRPAASRSQTQYSSLAIASIFCIGLFLLFLIAYQTPIFETTTTAVKALWAALFIIIAPALALVFSVISLKRYLKMHDQVRGMMLAYVSFVISAVYFVTALAMPLVLLGLYVVYVYIW